MKLINLTHIRSVIDDSFLADRVFSRLMQQAEIVCCRIVSRNTAMGIVTSSVRHCSIEEAIKTCKIAINTGVLTRRTPVMLEEWKILLAALFELEELSLLHDGIIPNSSDVITKVVAVKKASANYSKNIDAKNILKNKRREKFSKTFSEIWAKQN